MADNIQLPTDIVKVNVEPLRKVLTQILLQMKNIDQRLKALEDAQNNP